MQVIVWVTEKGDSLRANSHHQGTSESGVVCKVRSHAKLATALRPCRRTCGLHFLQPYHCMDTRLMCIYADISGESKEGNKVFCQTVCTST